MISKIDIAKFGLFKGFLWNSAIGKNETFKKLNIIYGRNYSGKTTLARIFKCFENNLIHKDFNYCGFSVTLSNGKVVQSTKLHDIQGELQLRVYNTDFVKENLSWLHKDDGTIEPFTILGAENVELTKRIQQLETNLGSIETKSGLFYDLYLEQTNLDTKQQLNTQSNQALEEKLTKRANEKIKLNPNFFIATPAKRIYSVRDIQNEIATIKSDVEKHILTPEQNDILIDVLKEQPLSDITPLRSFKPKFQETYNLCNDILKLKIKPTQPIQELLNDSLLQEWARHGIQLHKDKLEKCGFCNAPLSKDLWKKLDEHFSKESEELRNKIDAQVAHLEKSKTVLDQFVTLTKSQLYKSLCDEFDELIIKWQSAKKAYSANLDILIKHLQIRRDSIFTESILPEVNDESDEIFKAIQSINELVAKHSVKTVSLSSEQSKARNKLRFSNIAQFLNDIAYNAQVKAIKDAEEEITVLKGKISPIKQIIEATQEAKRVAESQAKDESRGAELINEYLSHFFGHNELKLAAEGTAPVKFKITRDGQDANNLSEGECSLISFCYFIAKIQDELKDNVINNKLVIYIDDPISSLDNNHVFFMFSLIENLVAKPKKFGQLFISTHNLDFLKYLKRLTKEKNGVKHFMIERQGKGNSRLILAPPYLKDYVTEFNYLFGQIHKCSVLPLTEIDEHLQYNFGNNMRKFLEAQMFYKYPTMRMSNDQKLEKYFNDGITVTLINRVINEYSHIGEQFERGMEPIDIDEIQKISQAVINQMKVNDNDQFEALLESVS